MFDRHDIDRLLGIGAQQREELLAVRSAARIAGSDPVDEGSNPSPPATSIADCSGSEPAFEAGEVGS